MIPGLTISKIDTARRHAAITGPGTEIQSNVVYRDRLTKAKLIHFIEFISSPAYCQIVGFGHKVVKLSSGADIKVPKVVRTVMSSRIISLYQAFCDINCVIPISRAALYRVIKLCSASQKTSLKGLDNTVADGMTAVHIMEKIVRKLHTFGLDTETVKRVSAELHKANQHLKFEIKGHIQPESNVASHCSTFALSDKRETEFQTICDHDHTEVCVECTAISVCPDKVATAYQEVKDLIPAEQRDEIEHDLSNSEKLFTDWHTHCVRAVHQDMAKQVILRHLQTHEVLLIMDWATKFMPFHHREKQTEFFGKKGISWHVSCAVTKTDET